MTVVWEHYLKIRYIVYIKYGFKAQPNYRRPEKYCHFELTSPEFTFAERIDVYYWNVEISLRNRDEMEKFFTGWGIYREYHSILKFAHDRGLFFLKKKNAIKLELKHGRGYCVYNAYE